MSEFTVPLHDGTTLAATAVGSGPALLLPVRTQPYDEAMAENMRQWGADPDLGGTLVRGLSERFRVIAADYEGHRMENPAAETLVPQNLVADLLAIADAAEADRFAYYGYSWLALAGLQLAVRTDRLWGLVMGGYPPVDGPYRAMLDVTRAAHEKALAPQEPTGEPVTPGDWDAAGITVGNRVTAQFVTLYEALQDFDDGTAEQALAMPRLAFAGTEDNITYGPGWGDTIVRIAEPLARHRDELTRHGWDIQLLAGLDHMSAMHSSNVLPLLSDWLTANTPGATR
ncbi:MAG: alpha/beta hydrolase [Propionicimonas sp.]